MMQFALTFLSNIPIWVPFLFLGFLWLGLRSSKEREMPKLVFYLFPLLSVISIIRVSSLPHPEIAWSVFIIASIIGALIGFRLQEKWLLADLGKRVRVSGEWATMWAIMILFSAQFVNGAVNGISPETAATVWFVALIGGIVSLATGSFLGRAIRIITS